MSSDLLQSGEGEEVPLVLLEISAFGSRHAKQERKILSGKKVKPVNDLSMVESGKTPERLLFTPPEGSSFFKYLSIYVPYIDFHPRREEWKEELEPPRSRHFRGHLAHTRTHARARALV